MQKDRFELAASYRRRTLYVTLGAVLLGACVLGSPRVAAAQDGTNPAPAAGTQTDSSASKKQAADQKGVKKPAKATLKVVPVPRTDTRATDAQGTPANPQTGRAAGNPQAGGAQGGGPGGFGGGQGGFGGGRRGGGQGGFGGGRRGGGDLSGFFGPGGAGRGTMFTFEFHGADITNVLRLYSTMSGLTITTDPGLTGPVTIINNSKPVTLDEAFRILQSVLSVRGYTAIQNGSVLSIVSIPTAVKQSPFVSPDPDSIPPDSRDQVMTQVIPLENVDATQLSKDLLPLINTQASLVGSAGTNSLIVTDTASSVKRIIALVNALDKTSSRTELKVYPLRHAEATNVAQTISDLYSKITPRTGGAQPGQQQFQQFQPPQQNGQQQPGVNARPAVIAVPDTRTNSVLVVASPDNQEQIARDIISRLDDDDSALDTQLIKIRYSNAQDVANLVNSVLSNMHGTSQQNGGGGNRFGGFNPFGGFGGFGGGGNQNGQTVPSTDPFGQVTADPRTNSLFVTANSERMARIKELVKQIDVNVPAETTTFVINLVNAKAEDIALALSQAFGTTSSTTLNSTSGTSAASRNSAAGSGTSRTTGRNGTGTSSSLPGITGRAVPPPPNAPDNGGFGEPGVQDDGGSAVPQGVPGVMTDQGFVPSNTAAVQAAGKDGTQTRQIFGGFGGGGFGGGQQRRQGSTNSTLSSTPTYGRGTNGNYANLLQLQNNVFVTPSPDGNSLIVTTTPDNYRALQQIVSQLDIIPQQVMIEVIIAEVTLDSDQKFGFNIAGLLHKLFDQNTLVSGQISAPAPGFSTSTALDATQAGAQVLLSGTNYSSIIQALNSDNKVKVMSTPRIFTSNAQQADIDINTYVPYINGQTTNGATTGTGAFVSTSVQYLPIGVTITVTPRITRDGKVTMDLTQDLSDLIQFDQLNTGQGTITAPRYNLRHADTSITVQNGQTVVVGGLIRDSQTLTTSKVPLLGDIPLVGQFFRSREKATNKVELVIFVTPHVIETDKSAQAISKEYGSPIVSQMPDLKKEHPELLKDTPPVKPKTNGKKPGPKDTSTAPDTQTPSTPGGAPQPLPNGPTSNSP